MRRRHAAVGLAALSGVGLVAAVAWTTANGVSSGEAMTQSLLALLLVALGTLLTLRVPANRVSWVVAVSGAATVLIVVQKPLGSTGALGAWLAAWTGTRSWVVSMGAVVTLGMLWFPTGCVPSSRWRWVERAVLAAFGSVAAVDRRFNRARYDAERVVASFGARLRDEVDLGALTGALNATVSATIVPRSVSLWLREVQP